MEKNIKDYLHLYLGAQIRMLNEVTNEWSKWRPLTPSDLNLVLKYDKKVEIQLRHVDDMTKEEKKYSNEMYRPNMYMCILDAQRTVFLLSKYIDLFGLIEAGLAIDKTTLKQ